MTGSSNLDDFDYKILRALQQNAEYSMTELGEKVGLSHTPCWRRGKKLQQQGIIQGKVIVLDPKQLGLNVTVYAYIRIKDHLEESLIAFESAVQQVAEIVECYSTSGEKDYVLRVVVSSVEHYERLLKQTLAHLPNVASVNSNFALKRVKYTSNLPI
ncbi:MAG: lrp/AsnC family transcriptional regulator [Osedax symbiont Rs2]|nr:MAG: lrp/AsnC family transcriptional regulator [Osedax symbiont Rs2]